MAAVSGQTEEREEIENMMQIDSFSLKDIIIWKLGNLILLFLILYNIYRQQKVYVLAISHSTKVEE